jgi:hypothetical protein
LSDSAPAACPPVSFGNAGEVRGPASVGFLLRLIAAVCGSKFRDSFQRTQLMLRRSVATLVVFFLLVSTMLAADKIVKGTLIKVEMKKQQLLLKTDDGKKMYSIDAKTKFVGPRGGVSDAGIKDDRLKPGTPLELVVAGNNKTLREVHLPERKGALAN